MTTIKATCPTCGDVDLTPSDVTVTVARALGWSTYTFRCAGCADAVCKPADDEVVQLLTGAGVRVERLDIPVEFLESRVLARTAGPMTRDDLLDFALWLRASDDVIAALLAE
jgi:ribosomal protein S28E/S33